MKNRTIKVGALARVEGEGGLDIRIRDGRVTGVKLKIGVVCLLRPSSVRSAIALDIASGSGSSCNTIATRSPSPTSPRNSFIFCLV